MVGQKLHDLLDVMTISQMKLLDFKCNSSSDKRYNIFKLILRKKEMSLEELNQLLEKEVTKMWPNVSMKEQGLKIRRCVDFFCEQLEEVILETFLDKNSSAKNVLLAYALEKSGNLNLLSRYYNKAHVKSIEEEETYYHLMSLKGMIRMSYASQSDKDLERALQLNEEYIEVLEATNRQKRTEYFNNISNVYLEKNSIVRERKLEIAESILAVLESEKTPINRVSLFFSLAKLNYDDDLLRDGYFEKAKALLSEIEERTNSYYELDRRIRFLELRLSFFSGKKVNDLMRLSEEILKSDEGFSIINNNTLFYYILLHIVDGKIETAEKMLEENHLFFKGTGVIMEDFLNAVLFEHKGDHKRSIKLLNPILYTTQYFFTIFSRLVLIKIHLKRDNRTLCKSLIDSTAKLLVQNSGNPLGKEANEYVLSSFRRRIGSVRNTKNKGIEVENEVQLSVFHEYLLKD